MQFTHGKIIEFYGCIPLLQAKMKGAAKFGTPVHTKTEANKPINSTAGLTGLKYAIQALTV